MTSREITCHFSLLVIRERILIIHDIREGYLYILFVVIILKGKSNISFDYIVSIELKNGNNISKIS